MAYNQTRVMVSTVAFVDFGAEIEHGDGPKLRQTTYGAVSLTGDKAGGSAGEQSKGVLGIIQDAPKAGEAAAVQAFGITPALVDGTEDVGVGDPLVVSATNKGVLVKKATLEAADQIVGYALEAVTTDDVTGTLAQIKLA